MNKIIKTMAAALAIFSSTAAMGQEGTGATKDAVTTTREVVNTILDRVQFNGYAQAGYEYNDAGNTTTSTMNLKRTLLWAKATISDRWSFLFMHDFNSEVQEYYVDFRATKGKELSVRMGQFKNSYSMENPMSPRLMELVDVYSQGVTYLAGCGSDPLYGVNYGRDLGIMLFGELFKGKMYYELAVMNGQGINCSDGNSDKDVILKLEYRPTKAFRIVASGQKGRGNAVGTAEWNPSIEIGDNYRRDRLSAGLEYNCLKAACPFALHGEWLWGKDGSVTSWGAYLTGHITIAKGLDIIASGDFFDKNTAMDYDQTNVTAGVQYWFYPKCRLQLQYTRRMPQWEDDYNCIQAQVQVAF